MAVVTPGSTGVGGIGSDFATIGTSVASDPSVASGPSAGLKNVPEASTRTSAAMTHVYGGFGIFHPMWSGPVRLQTNVRSTYTSWSRPLSGLPMGRQYV
jgi:hypothetical protein